MSKVFIGFLQGFGGVSHPPKGRAEMRGECYTGFFSMAQAGGDSSYVLCGKSLRMRVGPRTRTSSVTARALLQIDGELSKTRCAVASRGWPLLQPLATLS